MEQIKHKTINTGNLWKSYMLDSEDVYIDNNGVKLATESVYKSSKEVIKKESGLDMTDIAVDECDNIYICDKKVLLIYEDNMLKEISLPSEIKSPAGIGIDKDTIYIADSEDKQPNQLIALARYNLQIRWILSKDKDNNAFEKLSDIVVGNDGYIYVLEKDKNRVIKVSRSGNILDMAWDKDKKLSQPSDISIDLDGDIYVLDGKLDGENNRFVHIFNNDGTHKRAIPIRLDTISSPSGISVDKDKSIFIGEAKTNKDDTTKTTYRIKYWLLFSVSQEYQIELDKENIPDGLRQEFLNNNINISQNAIVSKIDSTWQINDVQQIYVIKKEGDKLNIYEYSPLWIYRNTTRKLISDSKGNIYVINGDGGTLTLLKLEKVNKSSKGTYISKAIDSQSTKTRWHRVLLNGEFKSGTQVKVSYFTSDTKPEKPEDEKRLLSKESLPLESWTELISGVSSIQGEEERDALFQRKTENRYLWFRIELHGNETLSPILKKLTVYFPRSSYLDYLPAIYREDKLTEDFLERFLSIFESIFQEAETNIAGITRFFDALGTPPEFLSWLGSWLSVSADNDLPEYKKRLLIQNAVSLYKKRGTREGIEEMIKLWTDKLLFSIDLQDKPKLRSIIKALRDSFKKNNIKLPYDYIRTKISDSEWQIDNGRNIYVIRCENNSFNVHTYCKTYIVERFQVDRISQSNDLFQETVAKDIRELFFPPSSVKVKDCHNEEEGITLLNALFGNERFSFCVFLANPELVESIDTIRRIVEEQKPAHTYCGVKILEPWFYLDMHTYLGVNTRLTRPVFILEKSSVIGRDTVLQDTEEGGQVERHSRLGIDAKLT